MEGEELTNKGWAEEAGVQMRKLCLIRPIQRTTCPAGTGRSYMNSSTHRLPLTWACKRRQDNGLKIKRKNASCDSNANASRENPAWSYFMTAWLMLILLNVSSWYFTVFGQGWGMSNWIDLFILKFESLGLSEKSEITQVWYFTTESFFFLWSRMRE